MLEAVAGWWGLQRRRLLYQCGQAMRTDQLHAARLCLSLAAALTRQSTFVNQTISFLLMELMLLGLVQHCQHQVFRNHESDSQNHEIGLKIVEGFFPPTEPLGHAQVTFPGFSPTMRAKKILL